MEVRDSLSYYTYTEHSHSLLLAADENLELLRVSAAIDEHSRIKTLGLYRSSMILYSISLELILKARALFEEEDWLRTTVNPTYKDFLNRWNGNSNGHDFFKLINHYQIQLFDKDKSMLNNFKEFSGWAGRYPYPRQDELVKQMEKNGRNLGSVGSSSKRWVHEFIERQKRIMSQK